MGRMTDAHLHKLQWIRLCDGHAGAISVMKEMYKRFSGNKAAYFRFFSYLKTNMIYGATLYYVWKEICQENYDIFLTHSDKIT